MRFATQQIQGILFVLNSILFEIFLYLTSCDQKHTNLEKEPGGEENPIALKLLLYII